VGIILYDADRIRETASAPSAAEIYPAHLNLLLDPVEEDVRRAAAKAGIAPNVLEAAARSPVFKLAQRWRLALPLHPEYRTLPMVWYIPPLSPIRAQAEPGREGDLVDQLRIPITYLANMLTAGDEKPVRLALKRLAAIRSYMRSVQVEMSADTSLLEEVDLSPEEADRIYRLLALAPYGERFVLPTAAREQPDVHREQGCCGFADAT
jgi:nitrate reductase beta subunit